MTESITDKIVYFLIANFIFLLASFAQQVKWQTQVDNRLQVLEQHASDRVVHMPLEEKINLFVPRVEIDGRLKNIEDAIKELSQDIKKNFAN